MKKLNMSLLLFLLLFTACSNFENNQSNGSTSGSSNSITIDLPSQPSSSDVFKQIMWVGDAGGGEMPGDLGACNKCNVDAYGPGFSLKGFKSNQELEIIFYKEKYVDHYSIGDFLGSFNVTVDVHGNLELSGSSNDSEAFIYIVYDSQTHQIEWQKRLTLIDKEDIELVSSSGYPCDSSISTRLQTGVSARVAYNTGSVKIRTDPMDDPSTRITSLNEGTLLSVVDGPACNDGYVWWYVKSDRYEGWMAESNNNMRLIEPIN